MSKKVPVEKESELSMGGAITFLAVLETKCTKSGGKSRFSLSVLSSTVYDSKWHQRKAIYGWNILNCRKTSKKNARSYSQEYFFCCFVSENYKSLKCAGSIN